MKNGSNNFKYILLPGIIIFVLILARLSVSRQTRTGQVFLYGEVHSSEIMLEKEFQLWDSYYHKSGMRDLFIESPYYTAEFLNIWIQSENDDILEQLFRDLEGTAACSEETKEFYRKIKSNCPETIFHGTDVGHQYSSTGMRYLEYLRVEGLEGSEKYLLTLQAIEQGKYYYEHSDGPYRETTMTENFIREFDGLVNSSVMGIYGAAHTGLEAMDHSGTIPCMANQLHERYGSIIHSGDLRALASDTPVRTGKISLNNKEYEAVSFGKVHISSFSDEYKYREFWRLEHAYEDCKNNPVTGDVLPYSNYPVTVRQGQVFAIDYIKADNSVVRKYYRSDGDTWNASPVTREFTPEK